MAAHPGRSGRSALLWHRTYPGVVITTVYVVGSRTEIRAVAAVSGIAWVWSWYTMYLEIHRWKHGTRSFRFNPGPPIPGTTIRPKPGLPLKALYACTVGAPVVFVAPRSRALSARTEGRTPDARPLAVVVIRGLAAVRLDSSNHPVLMFDTHQGATVCPVLWSVACRNLRSAPELCS